jgi:hypothetical protein
LGLGKSLTGLGLKKFKKPWAWACPKKISTPAPPMRKQYFSYIATVSYFGGRNRKKPPTCDTNKKTAILKDGTTIIAIIGASPIASFWAPPPPLSEMFIVHNKNVDI